MDNIYTVVIQMKREELSKPFMMILNRKKTMLSGGAVQGDVRERTEMSRWDAAGAESDREREVWAAR